MNDKPMDNEIKKIIWKQIIEGELREKIAYNIESVKVGSLNGLGMQMIAAEIVRGKNV